MADVIQTVFPVWIASLLIRCHSIDTSKVLTPATADLNILDSIVGRSS